MDDLISRQAAIDALQKEINKGVPPFNDVMGAIRCGVRLARNIIEDLPSADAQPKEGGKKTESEFTLNNPLTEEDWDKICDVDMDNINKVTFCTKHSKEVEFVKVVRCGECRHWHNAPTADGFNSCEMDALIRHENFFCANGEKKDDNTSTI